MGRTLTNETMPGQTKHRLVGQGVAWVWPTTIARWAQKPKHRHAQAALRIPKRDLEKPKTESPPGETIKLPKSIERLRKTHRGTGREQRDAPCRPCRLRHERRARVLVGNFQLELSKPRHSSHQGKHYQTPSISLHTSIRPRLPDDSSPEPPGGLGTKHRTCSEMHQNAPCCVMKRRLPHST